MLMTSKVLVLLVLVLKTVINVTDFSNLEIAKLSREYEHLNANDV